MEIRHCHTDDLPSLCRIYNHYIEQTIATFEETALSVEQFGARVSAYTQHYPWLVCVEGDLVVGYAYANKWHARSAYRHSLEITVYLSDSESGKGYGSALYRALLQELAKLDCHVVVAAIALPNAASIKLHERFGFYKVAHFHQVGHKFGHWVDVGYWQKILENGQQNT